MTISNDKVIKRVEDERVNLTNEESIERSNLVSRSEMREGEEEEKKRKSSIIKSNRDDKNENSNNGKDEEGEDEGNENFVEDDQKRRVRSGSRSRLKESITELVHKIRGSFHSPTRNNFNNITENKNPEQRGRSKEKVERSFSIGRGGVGNMISNSSRERSMVADLRDQRESHNRIINNNNNNNNSNNNFNERPRSHGRGGAGNIRSPSRDPEEREELRKIEEEERRVELNYADRIKKDPISIGRGGIGNIIHS